MSRLSQDLNSGKKVITVELAPPKGTDFTEFRKNAEAVKDYVSAYNVTDNQRAVMRITPLVASHVLLQQGLEPIFQITCRDRNRLAIQSDLLGAAVLGIDNVLALTGDHVINGDHPQAKPVFDLDSVQLLYTIKTLNEGKDLAGKALSGSPNFFPGAVVNPSAANVDIHIWRMKEKVKHGAKYFQTQVVFDKDLLSSFMESVKCVGTKILAGVLLVKSAKMARFLNENVPGVHVPDWVVSELENTEYPKEAGVRIAAQLSREFLNISDGVHIMAVHEERLLPDILKQI